MCACVRVCVRACVCVFVVVPNDMSVVHHNNTWLGPYIYYGSPPPPHTDLPLLALKLYLRESRVAHSASQLFGQHVVDHIPALRSRLSNCMRTHLQHNQ